MKNTKLNFIILLSILFSCNSKKGLVVDGSSTDANQYIQEVIEFQQQLTAKYLDPEKSPLDDDKIPAFEKAGGFEFFEINPNLLIVAKLDTSNVIKDIGFQTSTERIAMYDRIGIAIFQYHSKEYQLSIYESHYARNKPDYNGKLFLPFNDLTNSDTSYGGGRYLDIERQNSDEVIIDFNKSYNPYCAYSDKYSCPVPPRENNLNFEVNAGIKYKGKINLIE